MEMERQVIPALLDLTPEELERFVESREDEIVATLYLLASRRWAQANLDTAKAVGDMQTLKARMVLLQEMLEWRRKSGEGIREG